MDNRTNGWPQVALDIKKEYRHCFACGPDNPIGLKLAFRWDGKEARAEFTPSELHQGWSGVLHGGIIMTVLDEALSYAALFEGVYCITARVRVKLSRPVPIGETLLVTGSVTRKTRKIVESQAAIALKDGTIVAAATATQFVVDHKETAGNA